MSAVGIERTIYSSKANAPRSRALALYSVHFGILASLFVLKYQQLIIKQIKIDII
jgi:hypothetical protein